MPTMGYTGVWRHIDGEKVGFPSVLAEQLQNLDTKYPGSLPNLRTSSPLLIASDYSGEHIGSPYVVYSLLLAPLSSLGAWELSRRKVREEYFTDSRRMAFKRLNDAQRFNALTPLLTAANTIEGLSLSIAVQKGGKVTLPLDLDNPSFAAYKKWKPQVLEKAGFLAHVLGVLMGGLAAPGQDVLWFTDEDGIAANDQRLGELINLFAWISSRYVSFNMGRFRCGTSRCDEGSLDIEDLLSIPDLVAGALAEQIRKHPIDPLEAFMIQNPDYSPKTQDIVSWFVRTDQPLRRVFCAVRPATNDIGDHVSLFHFHNQP